MLQCKDSCTHYRCNHVRVGVSESNTQRRRSGFSDTKKRISTLALDTLAEEANIQSGITHARRRKRVSSLTLDLLAKRWCSQNAHFDIVVISPHNHGGATGISLRQSTRYSRAKEKQNVHGCSLSLKRQMHWYGKHNNAHHLFNCE